MSEERWGQPLIRNCQFAFRCHQRWKSLEQTVDPHVRYCHECSRPVVLCKTDDELREALLAEKCVAVPTRGIKGTLAIGWVVAGDDSC
jgi:hypothetical protein